MSQLDVETRLANLEAKDEIRAFIANYCAANDKLGAVEELAAMFTDDAVMRNPAGAHVGRAAIALYYTNFYASGVTFARHNVMNQVITILEPGVARHEAYFVALLGRDGESKIACGRYDDLLVNENGAWRFKEKINDIVAPTSLEAGWATGFEPHEALVLAGVR